MKVVLVNICLQPTFSDVLRIEIRKAVMEKPAKEKETPGPSSGQRNPHKGMKEVKVSISFDVDAPSSTWMIVGGACIKEMQTRNELDAHPAINQDSPAVHISIQGISSHEQGYCSVFQGALFQTFIQGVPGNVLIY